MNTPAQPFDFPDVYMPYPVRANPHLADLRRISEDWARRMGMLAGGDQSPAWVIWADVERFRAIALPELASFAFPDASASNLALIHEILVWILAYDDGFTQKFKLTGDVSGARAYAGHLSSLLWTPPGEQARTLDAIDTGLVEIRAKMADSASARCLRTWLSGIALFINGAVWEIENIQSARVPDLVEFVQMRRWTFAAHSAASYVDLSVGAELPERIMGDRSISAFLDAFMDWMGLSNDIFSYQREMQSEGELNNLVLVLGRLLCASPQQAVIVANDLITARLHHLDHLVENEIPRVMDKYCLSTDERIAMSAWIHAARSYLAGLVAWTECAARYAPGAV
ncbi:terpene synthase family protein [Amycolatopsis sp. NPDC054798]